METKTAFLVRLIASDRKGYKVLQGRQENKDHQVLV
jgi:hypothetical protein